MAVFAGTLLLLVGAWVLSNRHDMAPVPRPSALVPSAPRVVDEVSAFFSLVGLHAAADRDPATAGRASWLAELGHAARWRHPIEPTAASQRDREDQAAMGVRLPRPAGPPLICDAQGGHCAPAWIDQAEQLAVQRQTLATVGERCERLLGASFEFEERLGPMQRLVEPIASHAGAAVSCSSWLQSGAVLAWVQGRPADARALLAKADRLSRGLLAHSHSLIGQVIAMRLTRDTQSTIVALAVRDRAMAVDGVELLAPPLPDQAQAVRRWVAVESAYQRGALNEVSASCLTLGDLPVEVDNVLERAGQPLLGWLCRERIGWHPERLRAATDARWLSLHDAVGAGLPAAMAHQAAERVATEEAGVLGMLTWRNTLGNLVLSVGQGASGAYIARHADVELHREAALLAVQAAALAPSDRAAWTQRQSLSPLAQGRLTWDAPGSTLSARAWQQDVAGRMGFNADRDAIRFMLPKP